MRPNRELGALAVLLLVFVVAGLLLTGRDDTKSRQVGREPGPDPSVFNDRASGSRGCFDWVARLGYKPAVWRQNWSALGQSNGSVLMIIDPRADAGVMALTGSGNDDSEQQADKTILSALDASALLAWLRAGHTAILLSSRLPSGHTPGDIGGDDTFADAIGLVIETASPAGRTEFSPLQPVPETLGVLSIHSEADARLRQTVPNGLALFGDSAGPFVLSVPVGRGKLIAVADSRFVSNTNLARSENAAFIADVLARNAPPGAIVLFDEYHHGDAALEAGANLWTALGRPLQLALIQAALALAVLVGVVGKRFGAPIPLGQGVRRNTTEYVASLANLYQRAQASTAALQTLYRQFLRDLSARLALPPDVSLEQLADVAARRGGADRPALRALLATCEQRLDDGKVSESELLDLAQQMDRIRKEIGIG